MQWLHGQSLCDRRSLRSYHHVNLDREFLSDCEVWKTFLLQSDEVKSNLCRPFVDVTDYQYAKTLNFYSDAALTHGMGAIFGNRWIYAIWSKQIMESKNPPSIQFLNYSR